MKQHITKEQWDELSIEDKGRALWSVCCKTCDDHFGYHYHVTIGQMIEFL